jgi:hypothetical protein
MSIKANELRPPRGATKTRTRSGRGNSAGRGTTAELPLPERVLVLVAPRGGRNSLAFILMTHRLLESQLSVLLL